MASVFSIGQMAKKVGREIHQVRHVIESRGMVPVGKVGSSNAYDEAALEQVRKVFEEREVAKGDGVSVGTV